MKFLFECLFKIFFSLVYPGFEVVVNLLFIMTSFSYGLSPSTEEPIVKVLFFHRLKFLNRYQMKLLFSGNNSIFVLFLQTSCIRFAPAGASYAKVIVDVMTSQDYTNAEHPKT